jgi:hypothetical protein
MAIFGDRGGLGLGGRDILFATMGSMFQKNVKVVFDTLEWIYLGTLYVPGDWFGFGTQKRNLIAGAFGSLKPHERLTAETRKESQNGGPRRDTVSGCAGGTVHGPLSRCLMYCDSVFLASLSGLERSDGSLG